MIKSKKAQIEVYADFYAIIAYIVIVVVFLLLFNISGCKGGASHQLKAAFSATVLAYTDLQTYLENTKINGQDVKDFLLEYSRYEINKTSLTYQDEIDSKNEMIKNALNNNLSILDIKYKGAEFSIGDLKTTKLSIQYMCFFNQCFLIPVQAPKFNYRAYQPLPQYLTLLDKNETLMVDFGAKDTR